MPPANEHTVTAPLPEIELRQLIHQAYGDDESTAMLTQVMFWSEGPPTELSVCVSLINIPVNRPSMSVSLVNIPVSELSVSLGNNPIMSVSWVNSINQLSVCLLDYIWHTYFMQT
jgi:hypothetical protein